MLLSTPLAFGTPAQAEDPPPPRPIAESVDRVVDKLEEERKAPCRKAIDEGVPCFPVSTEIHGPKVSVRDSLGDLGPAKATSPDRPPTKDDMGAFRPGPTATLMNFVTFDPVCVGKSLFKSLKGKNDTYYLYRVRDAYGERIVLQDRRLNALTYQGDLEFLGRFDGECNALAAYRREDRKLPRGGPD